MGELLELRSPIPVETPLGRGYAIFIESDREQFWTIILNDTRAFVTFKQEQIRANRSYTSGRSLSDDEMRQILAGGALPKKSRKSTLPRTKPRVRSRRR